jgi:hypothetical protein
VTLQYFDEVGGRHEALGVLERVDMEAGEPVFEIRKKDDSTVRIPMGRIRAGRVVPPASRKG